MVYRICAYVVSVSQKYNSTHNAKRPVELEIFTRGR